jgi:hypothetical protein
MGHAGVTATKKDSMNHEPVYQVPPGNDRIPPKTLIVRITLSSILFGVYAFLAFMGVWTYIHVYSTRISRLGLGFWAFSQWFWHAYSNAALMGIVGSIGIVVSGASLVAQIAAFKNSSYQRVHRARFWYRFLIKTTIIIPCVVVLLFIINVNTY